MHFSDLSAQALAMANQETQRLGQTAVGSGHLLLALLQDETCKANVLLRNLGADLSCLRQALESQLLNAPTEEPLGAASVADESTIDEKRIKALVRAGNVIRLPADPTRLPQTATLKRGIEQAMATAREIGPSQELLPGGAGLAEVGTIHLLLGILLHGSGPAVNVLTNAGVDAAAVRNGIGRVEPGSAPDRA